MDTAQLLPGFSLQCAPLSEHGLLDWERSGFQGTLNVSASNGTLTVLKEGQAGGQELLTTGINLGRTVWRASACLFFISPHAGQQAASCLAVRCADRQQADALQQALAQAAPQASAADGTQAGPGPSSAAAGAAGSKQQQQQQQHGAQAGGDGKLSVFDTKTDKGSSDLYFKYYGMLQHQQNMLQDYTRTGMYYTAIMENRADFEGKVVLDVGAGSGILSLFAAMAGARKVYAVEASGMARWARQLADGNPSLGSRIVVVNSKVEEADIPEKVDLLVSEPMGTLLVNERMLETYLYARDHFLKPGGKMYPQVGRIHVAAFQDELLHAEVGAKSVFWAQNNFYGVDVTPLFNPATEGYYAQVVVDAFDTSILVSSCETKVFDFGTCHEPELHDIQLPLRMQVTTPGPCMVHGLACWFDVLFNGSTTPVWLSTAPGLPTTHWFQLRCVLKMPIVVPGPGCVLTGQLRLVAHRFQSYDVHLTLTGPPLTPGGPPQTATGVFDLKEPYYRQLSGWWHQQQVAQQQQGTGQAQQQPQQQQAGQGQGQGLFQQQQVPAGVPVGMVQQQGVTGQAAAGIPMGLVMMQQPAQQQPGQGTSMMGLMMGGN